jgi:predicted HTH domain antitoxin
LGRGKMNEQSKFKERMLRELKEDIVKKYSLLLLNAIDNEPIKGKTIFMKELFLISKNIVELEEITDFEADNYGPSSDYVSNTLEDLEVVKLLNKINGRYMLTDSGKEIVDIIKKDISENEIDMIEDMKRLCNNLNTDEILALVYYTYPEMTIESLVKDKIESKREKIALSLLKKGKVSIGKASEIAGFPMNSFYKLLKEKKIKIEMGFS